MTVRDSQELLTVMGKSMRGDIVKFNILGVGLVIYARDTTNATVPPINKVPVKNAHLHGYQCVERLFYSDGSWYVF